MGGDARFIETGRLLLFAERDAAAARANVAMNRALGVDIQILTRPRHRRSSRRYAWTVSLSEHMSRTRGTRTRWPRPMAFAEQATNRGAEILTGCAVTGIRIAGGRVVGVETQDGLIETDAVVAATGPWANQLAAPLGETLPISPLRVQTVHLRRHRRWNR